MTQWVKTFASQPETRVQSLGHIWWKERLLFPELLPNPSHVHVYALATRRRSSHSVSKRCLCVAMKTDTPRKPLSTEQNMVNGICREARGRWLKTQSLVH